MIQQGRLAEQNTSVSKGDLMSMVKFGADEIFKGKEATISDADIDTILTEGENRTASEREKMQTDMQHSLADFSLNTFDGGAEESLFTFEGQKFGAGSSAGGDGVFLNLPARERSRTNRFGWGKDADADNHDADYEESASADEENSRRQRQQRMPFHLRLPKMEDHQLWRRTRLQELNAEEERLFAAATAGPAAGLSAGTLQEPIELLNAADLAEKQAIYADAFTDWSPLWRV